MERIDHLMDLVDHINKTEELISLHRAHDNFDLMTSQYQALKAKQISQLIDELATPPFQSVESLSIIKMIVNK